MNQYKVLLLQYYIINIFVKIYSKDQDKLCTKISIGAY